MRKIIHLTTVHSRYDVRIFYKQCRSIAAHGYDVTLVVQDGQGDEDRDGIKIIDLGSPPSGRLRRILLSPWRAYRLLRNVPADIVHFHDPELLPVGFLLNRGKHHFIYDSHDDITRDILYKYWIPTVFRKMLSFLFEKLENFIAKRLDAVICATPFITKRFKGINPNSLTIYNYPIQDEFKPADERQPFSRTICYIGLISRERGITQLIEALDILQDVKLIICGPFLRKAYKEELMSLTGWKFVDYRGIVGRDEVSNILACSALGVATLLPSLNYEYSQPNKMFEYMAAGMPLVVSDFPLWRQIVEKNQCGVCVDPSSPEKIAQAIAGLLSDKAMCRAMGRAGREVIEKRFNWMNESKKLLNLYGEIK
ncbi:MAG: glycosyltransferase family 4 protein [Candidatus Aminicenantes bacterium]|nr:glycosyltransferase family 4 protein [Candidatus Aminicenantes bacterium]